jgi:protein TonB
MHDPVPAALAKSGESASKEYPWQPVSKPAEPMASALRRAAEAAEKGESSGLRLVSKPAMNANAATAPAPARETRPLKPEVEPIAANAETEKPAPIHKGTIVDEAVAEIPEPQEVAVPTFGMPKESAKSGGGAKKGLLTLLLLLLLAGAGYYGWTTVHPEAKVPFIENLVRKYITHEPTLAPPPAHPTPPKSPESLPMTSAPAALSNTDNIAKAEEITVEPQAEATHEAAASTAPAAALPTIHTSPALPEKASLPIVVKNGSAPAVPQHPAASEEAVQAPSLAPQGDTKTIAGLVGSAQAKLPKVAPQTVKISQGVSQGLLIKKVQPVYPRQAVATRTEGSVQLEATINKAGDISNLKVLAGQPVLAQAAVDAVKQWKYQPYYLNGDPVEIQTQVTVTFKLP